MLPLHRQDTGEILTVAQLNQGIRLLLESHFACIWVEGEISDFKQASSGHMYFTLQDESHNSQIRCAMFRGKNKQLDFIPTSGLKVLIRANISLYEPRGDYQLIIEHMEEFGIGALQRAFEALKKRLHLEGLFDARYKKPIPTLPQCIGVVTSPTGAAIHDILTTLKRRYPAIPVIIYPSLVQGEQAAAQLTRAIQLANQRAECDVLIVGRGGGSFEDLWPFNEEIVARAIFESNIPIISAVGHEVDFTIADLVADLRAPTPTAAAEYLSPKWQTQITELEQIRARLIQAFHYRLQQYSQQIDLLHQRLQDPSQQLREAQIRLCHTWKMLCHHIQYQLENKQHQLQRLVAQLHTLSPLATLQRGYAIVHLADTQEIVYHSTQVTTGAQLMVRLSDGSFKAKVTD